MALSREMTQEERDWMDKHPAYVYFAESSKKPGLVKVGSTQDLEKRLYQLGISYPDKCGPNDEITLLFKIRVGFPQHRFLEQMIHKLLLPSLVEREWYLSPVLSQIDKHINRNYFLADFREMDAYLENQKAA